MSGVRAVVYVCIYAVLQCVESCAGVGGKTNGAADVRLARWNSTGDCFGLAVCADDAERSMRSLKI